MSNLADVDAGAHILVVPYPASGHMKPLLDLSNQLANRGFTLTVVVTPKNLLHLTPLLSSHPSSVKTLILPFPVHTSIPSGVENAKDLHPSAYRSIMRALADLYSPLLQWFELKSFLPSLPPPVAIISDMFLGWTHDLACHVGIPRIVFSPSGAMALSIMYSLWQDMPDLAGDLKAELSFPKLPNCPKFPLWQVSPMYRGYLHGEPESQFLKDVFRADLESWGLVVNTFDGLERAYLDHLAIRLGHDRVWAVGPLLNPPPSSSDHKNQKSEDLFSWLDSCARHSVVYIAFGSQAVLIDKQMEELALGLEKSGVKFIWCVKEPTKDHGESGYGTIPFGFEQRVAGRGMVIKGWAPQVHILRHRAIGAFMTHCGWNSVLEAIVCGVPMLAWPMTADQFSNATLLVDELKVAVRVCEGAMAVPNSEELIQAVAKSVCGDREMRERAEDLRKAASEAVDGGGNSTTHLDKLAMALCNLKV